MERSLETVVALLGVLKSGGAYLPIDFDYPNARIALMLENSWTPVIITTQGRFSDRLGHHQTTLMCLDEDCSDLAQESTENLASGVTPQNLAYVIYTSGTSGTPKGVMIVHTSLVNYLCWFNQSPCAETLQVLPAVSKLTFDASLKQFLAPLLQAGQVWILPEETPREPGLLLKALSKRSGAGLNCAPSLWDAMLSIIEADRSLCPNVALEALLLGGEAVPPVLIDRTLAVFPGLKIWNLYGPTEATANAIAGEIAPAPSVALGKAISNTSIYLLDAHLQAVPEGVVGELYIGGAGLARGYLNQPDLTAATFIPNPFSNKPGARLYKTGDLARYLQDGNIEFLGRMDHQVKIRGFRVELREIECTLEGHPGVQQAVVLAREGGGEVSGEKRLVGYIVLRQPMAVVYSELRAFLSGKLPEYMVPAAFVFLDALPLTPNGKTDLKALPAPDGIRPHLIEGFVAPRTQAEQTLAAIWTSVLGIDQVGIRDNFFDLGGHSLLAVRLFAGIEKAFNKRPPLASLFQQATIEHLARVISDDNPTKTKPASLVAIQPIGTKRPFFCVHTFFGDVLCYMNLARHLGSDQPFYAIEARGIDGIDEPFDDIKAMAAYYIEQVRVIQPHGPYTLGGLCSAGIVAFEMAQQLRAKGEQVAMVALFDSQVRPLSDDKLSYKPRLRDLLKDIPSWLIGSLELNRSQWVDLIKLKIIVARAKKAVPNGTDGASQNHTAKLIEEWGGFFHFSEHQRKIARAQSRALRQYQPQVYPGRLTLFKARMQPLFSSHRPDKAWARLAAGGLDIRVVSGNQLAMLKEPHVRILAEQLNRLLA
jgi:amino acid adenylation domain-containing protein